MRILLISVTGRLPMDGSRLISALLKKSGQQVTNVYLARRQPEYDKNEFQALDCLLRQSDLVMIAVYSSYTVRAVALTEYIHREHPGILVVWGGPHCISVPQICLRHADAVCFSEGDQAVPEFIEKLSRDQDFTQTPNMAFKINNHIQINSTLPPFDALDRLPYYDYGFDDQFILNIDLVPIDRELMKEMMRQYPFYLPALFFLTSRGCPHQCSYCNNNRFVSLFGKNRIRYYSPDRVIEELKAILKGLNFIEFVGFGDDDFMARPEEQLYEIVRRFRDEIGLPFGVAASANTFHTRKFEILMDSGMVAFNMGVQSGSQRVLKEIYNRPISLKRTRSIVHEISQYKRPQKLAIVLDFIIDNPYETDEDIIATFHFLLDLPPGIKPNLFFLSFFPGTPIHERAVRDGIIQEFDDSHYRSFTRSHIRYQKNYETFLVLLLRYTKLKPKLERLPKALFLILASRPFRRLARLIPERYFESGINRLVVSKAQAEKKSAKGST